MKLIRGGGAFSFRVRSQFPTPIALPYSTLKSAAPERRPALAPAFLDTVLRFLAYVECADALRSGEPGEARDKLVDALRKDGFKRPLAAGSLKWLIESSAAIPRPRPILGPLHDGPGLTDAIAMLEDGLLGEKGLIKLRNVAAHEDAAAAGQMLDPIDMALGRLAGLADVHLFVPGALALRAGLSVGEAISYRGERPAVLPVHVVGGVEADLPWLARTDQAQGLLLNLDPFYRTADCEACGGEPRLFELRSFDGKRAQYREVGGEHERYDAAPAAALKAALEGEPWEPGRAEASYLAVGEWPGTDAGDSEEGRVLAGRIRLGGLIAERDIARVYEGSWAVPPPPGAPDRLAVKVLPYELLPERNLVEKFRREARHAGACKHPNLVSVVETGSDQADHYIAMELATGWPTPDGDRALDLASLPKPVEPAVAASVGRQLCEAAACLHGRRMIHKFIRPSNVFLFEGCAAKLEVVVDTLSATMLGNLRPEDSAYLAPEQAALSSEPGKAADVYGIGAVLYELLTGKLPYEAASPLAMLKLIADPARKPIPILKLAPETPKALADAVMAAMAKDPEKRPADAMRFYAMLETALPASPPARGDEVQEPGDETAVYLEFLGGPRKGERVALPTDPAELRVGRQPGNDLVLDDPSVSRVHARLVQDPEGLAVEDLGSKLGTRLNGNPVQREYVQPGDEIWFGAIAMRIGSA